MPKTIIITSASSGFGAMTAQALASAGHTVCAGMRDLAGHNAQAAAHLEQYASTHGANLLAIEMDVTGQASVDAVIGQVTGDTGRLDVILHNAGHMVLGAAEAFTVEQLVVAYDVNLLSTSESTEPPLPHLQAQRARPASRRSPTPACAPGWRASACPRSWCAATMTASPTPATAAPTPAPSRARASSSCPAPATFRRSNPRAAHRGDLELRQRQRDEPAQLTCRPPIRDRTLPSHQDNHEHKEGANTMFFLLHSTHLAWPLTVLLIVAMMAVRLFIRRGGGGRGSGNRRPPGRR